MDLKGFNSFSSLDGLNELNFLEKSLTDLELDFSCYSYYDNYNI